MGSYYSGKQIGAGIFDFGRQSPPSAPWNQRLQMLLNQGDMRPDECVPIRVLQPVVGAELLEAAHILPDNHPKGEPWVCNGISLCKLHHAAYDAQILGIRPDLIVEIRKDILEESDGPLLLHGLKGWHNKKLMVVPHAARLKRRVDFLEERYELFRKAKYYACVNSHKM